jgi:hypothetical protein
MHLIVNLPCLPRAQIDITKQQLAAGMLEGIGKVDLPWGNGVGEKMLSLCRWRF